MASAIVEIFELMKYVNRGSRSFVEGCRILMIRIIFYYASFVVLQMLKMLRQINTLPCS